VEVTAEFVRAVLHRSRAAVLARGHVWDVADVVDALADAGIIELDELERERKGGRWVSGGSLRRSSEE